MTFRDNFITLFILLIVLSVNVSAETIDTLPLVANKITSQQLLDPTWIEQRLKKVGMAQLLADYEDRKKPEVLIIRDALSLSKKILAKHPEALRNQLQARLVSYKEAAFKPFQTFPKTKNMPLRLLSPSISQAGDSGQALFPAEFSDSLLATAISPDGKKIVTARRNKLELWDAQTGKILQLLHATPPKNVYAFIPIIKFTPDGKKIISNAVARDPKVKTNRPEYKIWDVTTGKLLQTLDIKEFVMHDFAMTFDSKKIIAVVDRTELGEWNIENGKWIRTFALRRNNIRRWTISPDNKMVATSQNYQLTIWDLITERIIYQLPLKHLKQNNSFLTTMEFTSDSQSLLIGGHKGTLLQWNMKKGKELKPFEGHITRVTHLAFPVNGKQVISGSNDGKLRLWDLKTGELIRVIFSQQASLSQFSISSNCENILYRSSQGLFVENLSHLQKNPYRTITEQVGVVRSVSITPDGQLGISASNAIVIKNLKTNKVLQSFVAHNQQKINAILCTADSKQLLTCSNQSLRVREIQTGKLLKKFRIPNNTNLYSMMWAEKGKKLWVGGTNGQLFLWDFEKGKLLNTFKLKGIQNINEMQITSDQSQIIIRSTSIFSIFDIKAGRLSKSFAKIRNGITWMANLPGEKELLYTQRGFKTITQMGLQSDTGISITRQFGEHQNIILDAAVSPDGKQLVSVASDQSLKLWDIKSKTEISTLYFDHHINSCRFSPDSKMIIAGGSAGHVHYLKIGHPQK